MSKDAYGREQCGDCLEWFSPSTEPLDAHICGRMVIRLNAEAASLRSEVERLKVESNAQRLDFYTLNMAAKKQEAELSLALKERDAYREALALLHRDTDPLYDRHHDYHADADAEAQNLLSSEGKK